MWSLKSRVLSSLCAVLVLTAVVGPAPADEAARKVYQQTLRATARVEVKIGSGSGWIVDRDNKLLITNYHVVTTEDTELGSSLCGEPLQPSEVIAWYIVDPENWTTG